MPRTNYLKEILHNSPIKKKNAKKNKILELATELEDLFFTFKHREDILSLDIKTCMYTNMHIKLNELLHLIPDDLFRNKPLSITVPDKFREKLSLLIYKDKDLNYKIHKKYLAELSKLNKDLVNTAIKHLYKDIR